MLKKLCTGISNRMIKQTRGSFAYRNVSSWEEQGSDQSQSFHRDTVTAGSCGQFGAQLVVGLRDVAVQLETHEVRIS